MDFNNLATASMWPTMSIMAIFSYLTTHAIYFDMTNVYLFMCAVAVFAMASVVPLIKIVPLYSRSVYVVFFTVGLGVFIFFQILFGIVYAAPPGYEPSIYAIWYGSFSATFYLFFFVMALFIELRLDPVDRSKTSKKIQ